MKKALFVSAIAASAIFGSIFLNPEPAYAGYTVCQVGGNRGSYCFKIGDRGPLIYQLIEELRCAGYYTVGNDSYFGPVTQRAIRQFQRDYGLNVDGVAGPQTRNVLAGRNRRYSCRY